ncbi:MAG: LysM peptidoglycan-binding domain-containing protein [Ignavibacteria bacterium]
MRIKLIFNAGKCLFYFGSLILIFFISQTFNGCGGSEEEQIVDQREIDSIEVYSKMQKAFTLYKKALIYNQSADDKNANITFESSLKTLDEISYETITKSQNYFWKIDYDELAKSITEDYFVTQSELSQNSLIFEFAKRVPVHYDKVEQISGDREPMPGGNDIPLVKNSAVEGYIEFFSNTDRGRSFIDKCLYRSGKYFPLMRKILKFNNAPEELVYLSVQESGLSPTIVSKAGAVGLWQFMPATGQAYGLDQDGYRDDRRDFEKATDAAAKHLKDLYKTYDDWYLAFSAYNAGPGRVNKAISRSGSRDFWELRGYLPGETKNYVPSIIALSFVLRSPEEYGFKDVEFGAPVSFDRVDVKTQLTLQKIAELCETDIETIRELNSEITHDEVPQYDMAYQIRIPQNSFDKFAANFNKADDIDKSANFSPEFAGNEIAEYGGSISGVHYKVKNYEPDDKRKITITEGRMVVKYEFQKKDLLSVVAVQYSVRPTDIRIWNNINYGLYPEKKQELSIYLSEEKYRSLYGGNDVKDSEQNIQITGETTKPEIKVENEITKIEAQNPETIKEENIAETLSFESNITTESNSTTETNTSTEVNSSLQKEIFTDEETEEPAEEMVNETVSTTASRKINFTSTVYVVSEGDNLSAIARKSGVSVNDLLEWNQLESDKIIVGQKLKIHPQDTKISLHAVTAGENLTMIANEYNLSLDALKELNDLNDDVIFPGQKLKVINAKTSKAKNTNTSGVKKTYKVKKGETIASIAEANNVSVKDIKKFNSLTNDKIIVGQILKLYEDSASSKKQKVRKKKN